MIQINIEMPKDCNACPFSVHYDSGGAHGFYCSLSKVQEHRWGEANDDGFKFADCPISVVENKTQVIDKIRAEIIDTLYVDSLIFGELIDYREGKISTDDVIEEFNRVTKAEVLKIIDTYRESEGIEEEAADVAIMIAQLEMIFDAGRIQSVANKKIKRLAQRLHEEV